MKELINKTSRLVGLDLSYMAKNGSWVSLRFFVLALGGWVTSLLFARVGSKELLGQYQYVLSFVSLIAIISLPGLNSAATEAVVNGREAAVLKVLKISFLFSLLAIPIFLGIGIYNLYIKENFLIGIAFIFSGFLAPLYYTLNTWVSYYEGKSLFKSVSLRIIFLNIALNISLIIGLLLNYSAIVLVAIYLLVNILFTGIYFWEILKKINRFTKRFVDIKFGLYMSIQKFVYGLSSNLPPILISFLFGINFVAVYFIAFYVISAVFSLLGTLITLYIPKLFKKEKLEHKTILLQNISIGFVFWVLFIFFLKYLFIPLYGNEYEESRRIAYNISFLLFFVPLKTYFICYFMTRKKNMLLIISVLVANLTAFAILYFFKEKGFEFAISVYLYILEIITVAPLIISYIRQNIYQLNNVNNHLKKQI